MFTTTQIVDHQGAVDPVDACRDQNHQPPEGAIHARRHAEALVCRWQLSPMTGKLECVWKSKRIAAASIENDATQDQRLYQCSDPDWRRSLDYQDSPPIGASTADAAVNCTEPV